MNPVKYDFKNEIKKWFKSGQKSCTEKMQFEGNEIKNWRDQTRDLVNNYNKNDFGVRINSKIMISLNRKNDYLILAISFKNTNKITYYDGIEMLRTNVNEKILDMIENIPGNVDSYQIEDFKILENEMEIKVIFRTEY